MTLTIAKKWFCDYRECENDDFEERIGKRGERPMLFAELPKGGDWVKTIFQGRGKEETFHFCSQDCMEKELNLLTQQGLESPDSQRSIAQKSLA